MGAVKSVKTKATVNKSTKIYNKGVVQVKTVTPYSVASSVAKSQDTVAWLSHLKEFSQVENQRIFVTRDFWANQLNIDRKTIQRWEENIINKLFVLSYYQQERKSRLDNYQRFILSIIWVLKVQRGMTYDQIIQYMVSPQGNPFWMSIRRSEFANIESTYSRKAG